MRCKGVTVFATAFPFRMHACTHARAHTHTQVRKEWVRFSVMCASSAIQRLAVQTVEDMQRFASDCRASRQPPLDLPASPVTDASLEGAL